ncbi:MAG TPA: hypothetical protein VFJ85_12460 [Acidimicrobiales bacterium]|nr:hypothetical protein [Acidimicrobiales bacterium]
MATHDGGRARPVAATGATLADATATTVPAAPPPTGPLRSFSTTVGVGANNGRTRIERSLGCAAGGDADYWHFQSETALPAGVVTGPASTLPGDLRLYADVHSPDHGIRATPEPVPGPLQDDAFLLPDASRVALSNQRGTVKLRLQSGTCASRTVDFDGTTARTNEKPGTWTVVSSSGSYRYAAGSGDFDLEADLSPGADDPWKLVLRGAVGVVQPAIGAKIVDTYWGRDGVDYAKREVAVVYDVTNTGPGDSFNTLLKAASSPTPGTSLVKIVINGNGILVDGNTPVGTFPRALGDLASGETARVTLVWQLPSVSNNPPCFLTLLNCQFDTTLTFQVPDALDVPVSPDPSVTLHATAPSLPPPVS